LTFCASPIQILKRGLKRKLVPTIIDFMPPPGLGDQQLTTRGWLIVAQGAPREPRLGAKWRDHARAFPMKVLGVWIDLVDLRRFSRAQMETRK
jgi:hypothetical protein